MGKAEITYFDRTSELEQARQKLDEKIYGQEQLLLEHNNDIRRMKEEIYKLENDMKDTKHDFLIVGIVDSLLLVLIGVTAFIF